MNEALDRIRGPLVKGIKIGKAVGKLGQEAFNWYVKLLDDDPNLHPFSVELFNDSLRLLDRLSANRELPAYMRSVAELHHSDVTDFRVIRSGSERDIAIASIKSRTLREKKLLGLGVPPVNRLVVAEVGRDVSEVLVLEKPPPLPPTPFPEKKRSKLSKAWEFISSVPSHLGSLPRTSLEALTSPQDIYISPVLVELKSVNPRLGDMTSSFASIDDIDYYRKLVGEIANQPSYPPVTIQPEKPIMISRGQRWASRGRAAYLTAVTVLVSLQENMLTFRNYAASKTSSEKNAS